MGGKSKGLFQRIADNRVVRVRRPYGGEWSAQLRREGRCLCDSNRDSVRAAFCIAAESGGGRASFDL